MKFIVEYLKDNDARMAALRSGVPENYASKQGAWLKKHAMVLAAMETELDDREQLKLQKAIAEIDRQMEICKEILGMQDY
ncbi:hypothetical protein D3C86_2112460 [compost metagenome]